MKRDCHHCRFYQERHSLFEPEYKLTYCEVLGNVGYRSVCCTFEKKGIRIMKRINWLKVKCWFQDWAVAIISICAALLTLAAWFGTIYLIAHALQEK